MHYNLKFMMVMFYVFLCINTILRKQWSESEKLSYPLAVMEDINYHSYEIYLEPGDRLLLYTDGAVEAENGAGECFSEEMMKQVLSECGEENAEEVVGALQDAFFTHVGENALNDDASFLVLQRVK